MHIHEKLSPRSDLAEISSRQIASARRLTPLTEFHHSMVLSPSTSTEPLHLASSCLRPQSHSPSDSKSSVVVVNLNLPVARRHAVLPSTSTTARLEKGDAHCIHRGSLECLATGAIREAHTLGVTNIAPFFVDDFDCRLQQASCL